jgi:pimeloyl-ACP methyl ester carboxylesterase
MGAHTAVAFALRHPERLTGLVAIGPVYLGDIPPSSLRYWDGLAAALRDGGVEGFVSYIDRNQRIDPAWRDSVLAFTRRRMLLHRHPEALVEALREVPRSRPFESLGELEKLEIPALVVASHDDADPGHPYAAAATYAERLPEAELVSEEAGESPLAWQGGRLSRQLAAFYTKALSS